ncbi:hypothetical protein QL285_052995 [Trifolium repens]|nr:hypothetical protein QL285_052995 [Trifolium repens]
MYLNPTTTTTKQVNSIRSSNGIWFSNGSSSKRSNWVFSKQRNRLYKLKGVSVKIVLLWLSIVEVSRRGDDIEFSVGITGASFGADNFLESPQCGCGFDCNHVLRLNGDVSDI